MWRKVPCEQQLDTGESALSHGGNLYQTCGVSFSLTVVKTENRNVGERESG